MPTSIVSNATVATVGRVVTVGFGIVVTALLTRYLGPEGYGQYALLLSFGAIVQLCADLGLYLTVAKQIAVEPNNQAVIVRAAHSLRLAVLGVAFVIGILIAKAIPSLTNLVPLLVIVAVGLSLQSLSQIVMGVFQYRREVWRATVGDIVGRCVQLGGIVAAGFTTASLRTMVILFAAGSAAAYITHYVLLPIRKLWPQRSDVVLWRGLLQQSWPLGVMLLLNAIYFRIDTVILSLFHSSAEVGLYSLAYRVIESSLFFPAMLGGLLLPRLSEALEKKNKVQARQYLAEGLLLVAVVSGFVWCAILFLRDDLIRLVAGPEYAAASPLLGVLSLALVIMFFGNIFGFALVALNKQKKLLTLYVMLAIGNTLANFIAVPIWGAFGAAVTTIMTEAVAAGAAAWWTYRELGAHRPRAISNLLIVIVTTLIVGWVSRPLPVALQVGVITLAYWGSSIAFGTISKERLKLLRHNASVNDTPYAM